MRLLDIEKLLASYGYEIARTHGSHRHYKNAWNGKRLTLAYHSGKPFTWRRVAEIKKDLLRLEMSEVA